MAEQPIVCKFGGTSLKNAVQFRKVREIVEADPRRRYVVVSAPGIRHPEDQKVTDLLYLCHRRIEQNLPFYAVFNLIADRYAAIAAALQLSSHFEDTLQVTLAAMRSVMTDQTTPDFAASRGEYLTARLMASYLGWPFVDAAKLIFFDAAGRLDDGRTNAAVREKLLPLERAVIPGFYGVTPSGAIKTFPRGGSDISGAIVAGGVRATVYENWTDVDGLLAADPRVVPNAKPIPVVTYRELRELTYGGATVLHPSAVSQVRRAGIPVHIRNTNQPDAPGTLVVPDDQAPADHSPVTGIAGRRDFTVIELEKAGMNEEVDYARKALTVFAERGISIEGMPSGVDNLCVVVADAQLAANLDVVRRDLRERCQPDSLEVYPNHLALIAVVGRRMRGTVGILAKLSGVLAHEGVNIWMVNQGANQTTVIFGVENADYQRATRALYQEFFA